MRRMIAVMLLCSTMCYGQSDPDEKRDFQARFGFTVIALKLASLCGHGTGLARFAESILNYYPQEIEPCFK